ncbi:hypothetical protein Maes01_00812 [Microbulbifer aestuariivivens]|uniref:Uncharacterized protein n=1 Tax=Microbulbifer aestuariivivens TaxID=1908308 RepID=A0ABP9WPN2_9GAMM
METIEELEGQRHTVAVVIEGAGPVKWPQVFPIRYRIAIRVEPIRAGAGSEFLPIQQSVVIQIVTSVAGIVVI